MTEEEIAEMQKENESLKAKAKLLEQEKAELKEQLDSQQKAPVVETHEFLGGIEYGD